jgi:hypothetical protein
MIHTADRSGSDEVFSDESIRSQRSRAPSARRIVSYNKAIRDMIVNHGKIDSTQHPDLQFK